MSINPFCCASAVPPSFIHLLSLTTQDQIHILLTTPPSGVPLLTTFLASTASSLIFSSTTNLPSVTNHSNASYRAIIQVTKLVPKSHPLTIATEVSKAYYAPYGNNDQELIVQGAKEGLRGKMWKEISEPEANACLRPPGCGIEIGDGERWVHLTGMDRLSCESHRLFWELRAWVREA